MTCPVKVISNIFCRGRGPWRPWPPPCKPSTRPWCLQPFPSRHCSIQFRLPRSALQWLLFHPKDHLLTEKYQGKISYNKLCLEIPYNREICHLELKKCSFKATSSHSDKPKKHKFLAKVKRWKNLSIHRGKQPLISNYYEASTYPDVALGNSYPNWQQWGGGWPPA